MRYKNLYTDKNCSFRQMKIAAPIDTRSKSPKAKHEEMVAPL